MVRQEELKRKHAARQQGKLVIPYLYLGNKYVAENREWLQQHRIAFVLNVSSEGILFL
jgi:hypothetical protein